MSQLPLSPTIQGHHDRRPGQPMSPPAARTILGYAEIAERMNVDVKTVRIYASTDPDFPTRVTLPTLRSPGFSSTDVDKYLERRATRNQGAAGRPPRSIDSDTRVATSPETGRKIRDAIRTASAPLNTERGLADHIGLTVAALRFRLRGQTRWKATELQAIASALNTTVDALTSDDAH